MAILNGQISGYQVAIALAYRSLLAFFSLDQPLTKGRLVVVCYWSITWSWVTKEAGEKLVYRKCSEDSMII